MLLHCFVDSRLRGNDGMGARVEIVRIRICRIMVICRIVTILGHRWVDTALKPV